MTDPTRDQRHWMERERDAAHERSPYGWKRSALARRSGWGFVLCAAVAVSYGLWGLYGSGSVVAQLDATSPMRRANEPATRLGPFHLSPGMNPMRANLYAAHAPVGSKRIDYEIALEDATGRQLWENASFFGSRDDEASIVNTRTSLARFEVTRPGEYYFRVRATGSSMDDLRGATLELRRNVLVMDTRITWGFGLAALAFLITGLIAPSPVPEPRAAEEEDEEPRRAA